MTGVQTCALPISNTITVVIPLLTATLILSIVISEILLGTIKKQQEQYQLLQITQAKLIEQEKIRMIQLLSGGVAHDFNNILTAILGNINLLKWYENLPKDAEESIQQAERASVEARDLIKQLMLLSRDQKFIHQEAIDLYPILVENTKFYLSGSRSKPNFKIQENLWNIQGDKTQISELLQNLIINADQSMPTGGTITISAHNMEIDVNNDLNLQKGKYVRIEIQDQGIGIPKTIFGKIFDPFYTTKSNGTGLGLAICLNVVKSHRGSLTFDSIQGVGSTFTILLPQNQNDDQIISVDSTQPAKIQRDFSKKDENSNCETEKIVLEIGRAHV